MSPLDALEQRLQAIEERNTRVAMDKAWEISSARRMAIAILTYGTASVFLWIINASYPLLSALVPAGGYLLSTLSLPRIKRWWVKRFSSTIL